MGSGAYRDRAFFERRSVAPDAYGNVTDGQWAELFQVWGDFEDISGAERRDGGSVQSEVSATLAIRKTALTNEVSHADRVTVAGEVYSITVVRRPSRTGQIHLDLQRGVAP